MDGLSPLAAAVVLCVASAGCTFPLPDGGGVGSRFEDYLTGGGTLVLEIDHSSGAGPTTKTVDALRAAMGGATQKSVRVQLAAELPARGERYVYSITELQRLHEERQDATEDGATVVMHALFLDGRIEGDPAGVAFAADAFAVSVAAIQEITCADGSLTCLGQAEESNVMRAVAIHEAGHLLGLVNLGLPMVTAHEMTRDPEPDTAQNEGEGHSTNEASVMHWQVEVVQGLQNLITGGDQIPFQFDANDRSDMRAIQE